jgi:hypothetical protein
LNTEEILKGVREKRFKESVPEENIEERTAKIRKLLEGGIKRGHYPELKNIGADLEAVAYTLANAEVGAEFVKKVIQKRREFKNDRTFGKRLEKNRMKRLLLERIGKDISFKNLPKEERIRKQKELIEKLKKYPEYYLDKAILDLGSYFEVISPSNVKQAEERRQYQLIADLFDDFDLFKQSFNKAWDNDERDWDEPKKREHARERVVKRAEAIPANVWNEHIQGERERLQRSPFCPSIKR